MISTPRQREVGSVPARSNLIDSPDPADATRQKKRGRRSKLGRLLGQIDAVERDLSNPLIGRHDRSQLEAKRAYLYERRNALDPPEKALERIAGQQLKARRLSPDSEPMGGRRLEWPDRKQINHDHRDARIILEQRVEGLRIGATS